MPEHGQLIDVNVNVNAAYHVAFDSLHRVLHCNIAKCQLGSGKRTCSKIR
jgi:hypothetical protein